MAQKSKSTKAKRAPAYSADTMALHLVVGLVLIALGVMIFLAVVAGMTGDIFSGMRQVCHGLAGSLAFLLPVLPIWSGALVLMSAYRRAPLRIFLLTAALYLLMLSAINLFATSGSPAMPLMEYFRSQNVVKGQSASGFDAFLARSYELGARSAMGGGVLGMLLAWPLWQLLGNAVLAAILCLLMAAGVILFMVRLDMKGLLAMIQGKQSRRQARQEQEQRTLAQQELAWQQQMAQRQQYLPQGGWQEPPRQEPYPGQPAPGYYPQHQPYPNQPRPTAPASLRRPVPMAPEDDLPPMKPLRPESASEQKNRASRIFGRRKDENSHNAETRPRKSWIFSRREEDTPPEQPAQPSPIFQRREQPSDAFMPSEGYTAYEQDGFAPYSYEGEPVPPGASDAQPVYAPPVYEQPVYDEPVEEPRQRTVRTPRVRPEQPESMTSRQHAYASQESPRGAAWEEEPAQRRASWREDGWDEEAAPVPQRQRKPSKPAEARQEPTPSWADDTPPWEDAPAQPSAAPVRPPKLQQEPPKDAWKPELKLPPRKAEATAQQTEMALSPPYVYPSMNLLAAAEPASGISPEEDAMRSQRLEETLQSFKVPAKVRHVTHGPAISRFELELAAGIKVTKVTDLGKNIAMNMEVKSVRIEAPIPGKSLVGVEVPNRKVSTVTLREVLESPPMREAKSPLVVALGKDIAGTPIVCDLARMPHLLIAGATGSGKSVCINTMINSLLYRCSPREVRMILVDPKVVELQCYNGIPHLLIPVVSDPHKAAGALAWAVAEMMDRYKKFQIKGVRAIDGYNAKLEDHEEFMPRIVIIIDELADLMMTCKREVEDHICRLAQLARAAGIHLVVATQRPSVDVITGLIKANIPSRIAFKVSSFIDSRTILDRVGAEQLLGWGDMLYLPTGEFTPIRVQGCFLSDNEVNRITDFIRENCEADYDPDVLEQLEHLEQEANPASADSAEAADSLSGDSSLLAQCIEMAVNDGQVSTSLLQRRLKVGYARAGRLVDEMERRGIVSAKDGAKPRMCLISREEFEQMKQSGDLE